MNKKMDEFAEKIVKNTKLTKDGLTINEKELINFAGPMLIQINPNISLYKDFLFITKNIEMKTNERESDELFFSKKEAKQIQQYPGKSFILLIKRYNKEIKYAEVLYIDHKNIKLKSNAPKSNSSKPSLSKFRYTYEIIEKYPISFNKRVSNSRIHEKKLKKQLEQSNNIVKHFSEDNEVNILLKSLLSTTLFSKALLTKADFATCESIKDIKKFKNDIFELKSHIATLDNPCIVNDIAKPASDILNKHNIVLYTAKKLKNDKNLDKNIETCKKIYEDTELPKIKSIINASKKSNKDKRLEITLENGLELVIRIGTFNKEEKNANVNAELCLAKSVATLGKLTPKYLTLLNPNITIENYKNEEDVVKAFLSSKKSDLELYLAIQMGKLLPVTPIH